MGLKYLKFLMALDEIWIGKLNS